MPLQVVHRLCCGLLLPMCRSCIALVCAFAVQIEIDRFEGAKLAARKKYDMMAPPEAKPQDMATCAVDALCTLCLGETLVAVTA